MTDAVNTGGETSGAAPEGHDQSMLDAVEKKEAELAQVGNDVPQEQTEKILGKFNSYEDLEKAYQELERKQSQQPNKELPQQPTKGEANEVVESAGLNMEQLSAHYAENGGLADEHYEALEKAGIPRQYVDQYIAGLEAQSSRIQDEIFDEVGGEEQFSVMAQWAQTNMSPEELTRYNTAVESGDPDTIRSAVMSLAYRYQREAGRDPKLVNGNGGGGQGGFESLAQLTEAMKDPRYETDPAFRREVESKLSRSNIF